MKKSYISILLLFLVMILAISAASAAEIDDTSDSDALAADEATVDEVVSTDAVDDVQTATEEAEVLSDPVSTDKNFTQLKDDIETGNGFINLGSNYVRAEGEDDIEISTSVVIIGHNDYKIDANKLGGIFKITQTGTLTLNGVILVNGNNNNGGAIYNEGKLNLISSQISNSNASVGGAIYNNGIMSLSGSTLDENSATTLGGAIYNKGTSIVSDTTFEYNKITTASGYNPGVNSNGGAAIFTDEGSTLDVDKSIFTENFAPHDTYAYFTSGGAIYVYKAATATIDDSTFELNQAGLGGAIVFEGFSQEGVAVQNSEFNNNQAWQGAAINVNEFVGNLNIAGNNFTGNDAVGPNLGGPSAEGAFPASGGAVSIGTMQTTDTTVEITDCDFTQNTAEGGAGAISINANTEVAIENCDFIENEASYGIAIVSAGNTKINGSRFIGNIIGNKNGFATIYLSDSENSITNSNFSDNEPEWDVASFKGKLTLSNNEMNSDSATIIAYTNDDETPIVSTNFIVTILENGTVTTNNGIATITAKVTDDNNNLIDYRGNIKFIINDEEVIAKYNSTSKLYQASYTLPTPGIYVVNITAPDATFTIKTGAVKNAKGSFYDLKTQIDATTTGSLELGYDFAYTPIIDDEYGYVKGIEISNDISIDGKGHTINGSDSHRIFYVSSNATLTLDNIVLTNGNATLGGAILISNGNIIISNVNLTNNKATKHGGAIYYVNELTDDSKIINCVFENNEAIDGSGGAIAFIDETYSGYSLAITNTNFTNNKAGAAAGAIYVGEKTTVYIENSLFDGNEAPEGDAIYNWYGYLYLDGNTINSEDAEIYNVLGFIDSIKVTTFNATVAYGEKVNLTAIITDNNGNLIYDSGFVFLVKGSDYIAKYNATTKKYELKDQVFNLPVGTYDITVNNEQSPDDIVYIHKGILTATPKKGTFSDLQYQINALEDGETLDLAYDFTYTAGYDDVKALSTFDLANGVVINKNITINGNAYTISGNNSNRIFFVNYTSKFTLNNATLGDGFNTDNGGAIYIDNVGNPLNMGGSLIADHVTFTGNKALVAGAINVQAYGSLYVNECIFEDNEADITNINAQGGAIKTNYKCDVTIIGSNFTNNVACNQGGAIYLSSASVVNIEGSKFINNSVVRPAMGLGGALYVGTNTISITGSDFINSNATSRGGAIYISVDNANMQITDSTFIGNDAGSEGGAIYQGSTVSTSITGSTFKDNTNNNVANALYINSGKLYLKGNTINSTYAEIYNKGTITSTINAIVLENKTKDVKDMDVTLTAIVSDDKGNLIYDQSIKFNITGEDSPIATTVGYENYTASYTLPHVGAVYEVAMISTKADETVTSYNGILRNIKGTYTDLQNLIDDAEGNLVLPYDFAYNAEVDGESFPNGVVISQPIVIDGNGSTISGENSYRIFYINASDVELTDIAFVNGSAVTGGAIYYSLINGKLSVSDSVFIDNEATDKGGAIFVWSGLPTIEGSEFYNNTANANGGAICFWRAVGDIDGCYFENNNATRSTGGAVNLAVGGKVTNSVFVDNDAFGTNSALAIGGTDSYVGNCNFTGDYAIQVTGTATLENNKELSAKNVNGYAVYNAGKGLTLIGNKFNSSIMNGKNAKILSEIIVTVLDNKTINTTDDTFELNATITDADGNVIYDKGVLFTVNNESVSDIKYNDTTGLYTATIDISTGIYNVSMTKYDEAYIKTAVIRNFKGTFTDLQNMINNAAEGTTLVLPYNFTYNAEIDGDALKAGVVINKALTVDGNGSTISGADAARIFQLNANNINITNTTFTNGHANTSSQQFADWGGAIYSNGAYNSHVISDCKFYNNTAYNGGAIYLSSDGSDIIGCEFEDNNATASGGAVFLYGLNEAISDSTFKFNRADELGGAVACYTDQAAEITNSVFIGNAALKNGGAVSMQKAAGKITDSNFTGNTAYNGGAVYWGSEGGNISGGEFIENKAFGDLGGAIFAEGTGLTITSTFTENYADNGGAIAVFKDATITESTFTNNTAENYGGAIYVNGSAKLDITKSAMKNNTATVGSSIYSNGTIGSTIVNATILDNKTWNDTGLGKIYKLNATLTDDMGNNIYDPNFRFKVNGTEIADEPLYDDETGLYALDYFVEKAGLNVISTSYNAANLQVFTGALDIPLANVTEFTVKVESIVEGENATVFITLIGVNDVGLDSIVTLIVNNNEYAVLVKNGTGNITIENLAHGQYPVVAMFEDPNYEYTINSTVFNVKGKAVLNITELTVAEYGDVIEITINLTDSEGNPLSGVVAIGDIVNVLVEEGIGTFVIDTQPDVGNYTFMAVYVGDKDYFGDVAIFKVTVTAKELNQSEVEFSFEGDYDNGLNITITSPVDGNYTVDINGTNVTVEVVNGTGSAIAKLDKPDDYTAVITLNDENYSLKPIEYDVVYKRAPGFTVEISGIYPNAEIRIVGTPGTYHVNIDEFDTINITVGEYGLPGVAPIEGIAAGNYTAIVSYDANDKYRVDYKKVNFTIDKASSNVTIGPIETVVYGTPVVIKYNITNETDFVTISISKLGSDIPGEYVASEGTITANLTGGKYIIRIHNAESDDFNESEDCAEFTVEKAEALTITVDGGIGVMGTATVNVTVADDATGYVVVDNDGVKEVYELVNGSCSFEIYELQAGEYTINVTYLGDDNYNKTEATKVLDIPKSQVKAEITDVTAEIIGGQDATFTVTMNNTLATGTVSIFVDGVLNQVVDLDEDYANATVVISGLGNGTHTIAVQYGGDDNYEALENATTTITVAKAASKVTIEEIENVTLGNSVIIKYSIVNETEFVTISISKVGSDIPEEYVDSNGTITAHLPVGTYIVSIHNGENAFYTEDEATATFTVEKADDYQFEVNLTVGEIDMGENLTIDIELPEDANGNVTVYVDGVEAVNATVKDGKATVTVPASAFTKAGDNDIDVTYSDDNYAKTTVSDEIYVNYVPFDLTASAANIEVGQNATIIVNLPENADGYAYVILQGVTYDVFDGKVVIENLTEGTYTATVTFEDDSVYDDNETTVTFNVTKVKVSPEQAFNITAPENSTSQVISVNLSEDATGYLLLDINGTQTHVPLVNGKANVTVPNLAEGTYNATITYTGDDKYGPITTTKEINVTSNVPENALNIPDSAKSDEPTTYSISLPSNATGYLEVDVDGTKYVAALNNGSASVTIPALPAGNHNVTVTYTGDANYSPVSKATTLSVAAPVFKLSNNKNVNVVYSAKANYKVLVTRDGKAVGAGQTVTFKFNGKTYTAKTDSKGYATLNLNTKVKVKKYTITATYNGVTVKNTVNVKHLIKASNKKIKKSKKVNKIKVKTNKVNGKYLKGKKLTLKIKGKKVKAKINKKGVATFKLKKSITKKLKAGKKYKYTVTYGKDKVTKKVKVKR